ncbi:hypothetical protein IFM89_015497 [Coptis chinensis]|uniref:Pentatricopeptide repeat-containing protein n=1 Tax=Coptis chinensis TaxID=261450 RepID=A0A835GWE9_9MAGN|nr:hypothetical protein IFM89_015497 [Coptis chinensis]
MFTSISRLSRVFAKNTRITATPQILTKTQTPKQEEKSPTSINKLSKQKNLTTLVENEIGRFRSPHLVYEKTIARHQNKFDDITEQGFAMRFISLYGKPGMFDHALKLFDELPERTAVKTYNALLNASVVSNKFDETQKLFREPSLKKLPDFPSGMVSLRMEESGIVPDIISYNAKLQGFVNVGKISEAVELVEQLGNNVEKPNLFTYNVLIKWYGNNGNLDEAKSVYDNMLKSDIVPDWFTFEALIPCVCEKGEFGLALKLCEKSIGSNCHVSAGIVQVVVDGLLKESKVEEAKGLVEIAHSKKYYRSKLKMPQEIE